MIAAHRARIPFVALGLVALLAALWAGLVRLGWDLPPLLQPLPGAHGPLMVSGFVGTLISLERAVALGRRWTYAAHLLSGLGALVLLADLPAPLGKLSITLGSLVLVAIFVVIVRRQPTLFTLTMLIGAVMWLAGNYLWLAGWSIFQVVLWWAGYLVLTVAGERLELGRMLHLSRRVHAFFLASAALLFAGVIVYAFDRALGVRVSGIAMLALALWLLRYDIARRTVRQPGLTRFIALSLLVGYAWLAAGGLFAVLFDSPFSNLLQYDALLHSLFLGFIISMIFGHAPIILPAVLGRAMAFRSFFYAHLILLHLSLLMRVGGDLLNAPSVREWGGMLNVIALLLFLANTALALRARHIPPGAGSRHLISKGAKHSPRRLRMRRPKRSPCASAIEKGASCPAPIINRTSRNLRIEEWKRVQPERRSRKVHVVGSRASHTP